ncbi:MAG: hypothetical protein ABH881_00340 [bacterium]
MPKQKKQINVKNKKNVPNVEDDDVVINLKKSEVAEFVKRPLPTEDEVEEFEEVVEEEAREEGREEEVEESLNEIYQDDDGQIVDVQKMDIKKKRGMLFLLSTFVILIGIVFGSSYYIYNYFLQAGTDPTAVDFKIEGDNEVTAGQEFFYTVSYNNKSNVNINDAKLEIKYPENFIFLDSDPGTNSEKNNIWEIGAVPAHHAGKVKIKGMIIGVEGEANSVLAKLSYSPENFASGFSREDSATTIVRDIGLNIDFDYVSTALVGEETNVVLRYKGLDNNCLSNFRFSIEPRENVQIIGAEQYFDSTATADDKKNKGAKFSEVRSGVWLVEEVPNEERTIAIKLKFTDKVDDAEKIIVKFEKEVGNPSASTTESSYYEFLIKELDFEIMKSNLSLSLFINGSQNDQGIEFGQTLNYLIVYANKGETDMKDIVLTAALESNFLDWKTLSDENDGAMIGNNIIWTKEEIPGLATLAKHQEGTIDFFINVKDSREFVSGQNYEVKSYAQFNVENIKTETSTEDNNIDNRSNTIINKINSDLSLVESVRYFNEDDIPVGTGPNPPKVNEDTTYKVYWELTNSLHDLNDLAVSVKLPQNILWDGKEITSVGSIQYNEDTGEVVWSVGRLPATVRSAKAEFSIKASPQEENKNKIMVLLPGSVAKATDSETGAAIEEATKAQTSKLEGDEIGKGDGVVE